MGSEHRSNLEFSEIDLLKIYNTVPRTLSRSVIAASVILDNRGRDDRVALKQENSGNYWIIKIDHTKGWLVPKGGQRIDRYQYQTLESLFECQGYQPEGTRKFTIQALAKVSFNFDKDKWFLEDKGVLKFGNSSTFFELEAAQQECETLTDDLEQSRQENKQLQEKLEISKVNVQQLKRQLDLSLELQEAKNYQANISKKLESFRQEILYEIGDRNHQRQNIDLVAFKQEILDAIGDRIPQQPNIDLKSFNQSIINEISDYTKQQSVELISKNSLESKKTTVNSTDASILSISDIVDEYNNNNYFSPEKEISVSISTDKKDHKGNNLVVNDTRGNCWIIQTQNLFFMLPKKGYKFYSYQLRILQSFFDFKEYAINTTRKFVLEQPAIVICNGQDWRLEQKGILNFA